MNKTFLSCDMGCTDPTQISDICKYNVPASVGDTSVQFYFYINIMYIMMCA